MNDQIKFLPVNIAILTISDSRNEDTDISGKTLIDKVNNAGHNVINYSIVEDSIEKIRKTVLDWTKNSSVDVIISSGGTGVRDYKLGTISRDEYLEKIIVGVSAIFHMISLHKSQTSTIQSSVFAGIYYGTYVFCLPGSPSAVKDAWDEILVYQLDISHKPCNLIEIKDRLKE